MTNAIGTVISAAVATGSASSGETNLAFLCFFGIAIVFTGLVLLIGLIYLMNFVLEKLGKANTSSSESATAKVRAPATENIPNREELVAAVCAAVAEEEGVDVTAIRVLSFKKI